MSLSKRMLAATALAALAIGGAAVAQNAPAPAGQTPGGAPAIDVPQGAQVFGSAIPSVVKATAIVNGEVITQTDIDQRMALLAIANGGSIPADVVEQLRQQVLRNLIDETLQIQAAKAAEIEITDRDIERTVVRFAQNLRQSPEQLSDYLRANGSSIRSIRRQIHGELAWQRLQRAKIADSVSVGDEEVKAVLDRLNAAKGTQEYRVGEIFLSATRETMPQAMANAAKIIEQLRAGGSFAGYARQYSEASTAAVGGDLGWVRPELLPEPIAERLRQMGRGHVSMPIPVPGGVSIIAVQDVRRILTADPRNAVFSLKQISVSFPKGTTRQQAEPTIARFAEAARNVGGCGGAERVASAFGGDVVQRDDVRLDDLPPILQELMLPMQVGQATQPFGTVDEGVRVLVICGREQASANAPTFDDVFAQLNEERVNLRARRYLRDLRRDAVIEFR